MQRVVPQYYKEFKCIASKCKHNCCIGWEIDIDKNTYDYYKSIEGEFGKKLKSSIAKTDCPHFINADNGRCPHLNKNNLCNIILTLGEQALCEICTLHPRFINNFEGRQEVGLGLCCEEAARIVLTSKEKFYLQAEGEEIENVSVAQQSFLKLRSRIFKELQDRTKSIDDRITKALALVGETYNQYSAKDFYDILIGLERLDNEWEVYINNLCVEKSYALPKNFDIIAEQILCYFVFRHLSGAVNDGLYTNRLIFAVNSFYAIKQICLHYKNINVDTVIDIARRYSCEVEYSDKNLENLLLDFGV